MPGTAIETVGVLGGVVDDLTVDLAVTTSDPCDDTPIHNAIAPTTALPPMIAPARFAVIPLIS